MTPAIVHHALALTVTNYGQLSRHDLRQLEQAVAQGVLVKGLGGPFVRPRTVYAWPEYEFSAWRRVYRGQRSGFPSVVVYE